MKFTIPGEPQGKARPRVTRNGTFTPRKTVQYENLVIDAFDKQCTGHAPIQGPIRVRIRAYFAPPASAGKLKRASMLSGVIRPTKKPDYDNIAKIVCDALNGYAYHDDAQIVDGRVIKEYDTQPRVEVEIRRCNGETYQHRSPRRSSRSCNYDEER